MFAVPDPQVLSRYSVTEQSSFSSSVQLLPSPVSLSSANGCFLPNQAQGSGAFALPRPDNRTALRDPIHF